ncbi:hypothetical protein WV31_10155 [Magnetospirillum sp. ME-1]|nr:hypothetical protein WV31_10155 [Magnetospirillum sp. ME-1]
MSLDILSAIERRLAAECWLSGRSRDVIVRGGGSFEVPEWRRRCLLTSDSVEMEEIALRVLARRVGGGSIGQSASDSPVVIGLPSDRSFEAPQEAGGLRLSIEGGPSGTVVLSLPRRSLIIAGSVSKSEELIPLVLSGLVEELAAAPLPRLVVSATGPGAAAACSMVRGWSPGMPKVPAGFVVEVRRSDEDGRLDADASSALADAIASARPMGKRPYAIEAARKAATAA